jgi:Tfp pilus assembly protein PilE
MQPGAQLKFNLTELVMIIVVLCILAVVAVPIYYNLCAQARIDSERTVVGNVRAGIQSYHARHVEGGVRVYPPALDDAKDGPASLTNSFFGAVLAEGGVISDWSKKEKTYTGPNRGAYTYNRTDGTFR